MHILIISRSWPPFERDGVSLTAFNHAQILIRLGYNVSIAGSHKSIKDIDLNVNFKIYIPSFGSGSLYYPAYIDKRKMISALDLIKPDLVLIEAWQTAITDFSIDIAAKLGIPIAMISHGISMHPYTNELKYKLRALFWLYYRFFQFPKRLNKISALGVLDNKSNSTRFYDRDFALKLGLPVSVIPNMPINFSTSYLKRESRSAQIIVLGYFSPIKQQLAAINIFAKLPSYFTLKFIGEKKGLYYKKCLKKVKKFGLSDRVFFYNDQESNISYEISKSLLMLSTSITEALPIHILEAMASGTPFVSSSVGAIDNLRGGIIADDESTQINAILNLYANASLWNVKSNEGLTQYKKEFTRNHVIKALKKFIKILEDNQKNYG